MNPQNPKGSSTLRMKPFPSKRLRGKSNSKQNHLVAFGGHAHSQEHTMVNAAVACFLRSSIDQACHWHHDWIVSLQQPSRDLEGAISWKPVAHTHKPHIHTTTYRLKIHVGCFPQLWRSIQWGHLLLPKHAGLLDWWHPHIPTSQTRWAWGGLQIQPTKCLQVWHLN